MKFTLHLLTVIALVFHSCVTTKTYSTEEKKMVDLNSGVYVLKKDGQKITGKKITLPSSFVLNPNYIKLDNQKLENDDLIAYQDKDAFYKLFTYKGYNTWVKQLKHGTINLYHYETKPQPGIPGSSPAGQYHDHYVFEKESTGLQMAELSIPDIAKLLKDNAKAYSVFTQQFGTEDKKFLPKQLDNHPQVLFDAIDIYNGNK